MDQLNSDKKEFIEKVIPEWDKAAKIRQSKWENNTDG